ncbi:MAG: hypothetical protein U5M23_12630 [Marinagarivorans sp.]|nr:hypothetical protein [Marinagarivorans sp.]
MKTLITTAIAASLFASTLSFAETNKVTTCTLNGATRTITVEYPNSTAVPCQVTYAKNGESSVLWNAQIETGYCEANGQAFVEKQHAWGWQCSAESTPETTATTH